MDARFASEYAESLPLLAPSGVMTMNRWMWTLIYLLMLPIISPAAPAKDDQAEAQAILDKAIKALGGEEKLARLTSFALKSRGRFYFDGETGIQTLELSCDLPGRLRRKSTFATDDVATIECIINGDQGWISFNGIKTSELTLEQIAREKDGLEKGLWTDLAVGHLPLLKGNGYKLTPLGDSKIGDRRVVGIKITREGQSDIQLYFDKDTDLPVKRSWLEKEPATSKNPSRESVNVEVLFDDYKEVGGVKYPAKLTMFRNDKKTYEGMITELKIVEKFDEKTFAKPEK
jgi:hypothetical protein